MATCKIIGAFNDKLNKSRLPFMIVMISLHETTNQHYCSICRSDHENSFLLNSKVLSETPNVHILSILYIIYHILSYT